MSESIFTLGRFTVERAQDRERPFWVWCSGALVQKFGTKGGAIAEARTCHAEDQQALV